MVCSRSTRLRAEERTNLWGGIGPTMLSGFNTNFRYRGVLFHVQTEDSGRENPHVITHLFHGGNIIASEKQEYSALLVRDGIEEDVKQLMQAQHKTILRQLSRGEHDRAIKERLGPDIFSVDSEMDAGLPNPPEQGEPPAGRPATFAKDASTESAEPGMSAGLSGVFGDRVVSEKPLDEVVLDYLVENARKRRRQPK